MGLDEQTDTGHSNNTKQTNIRVCTAGQTKQKVESRCGPCKWQLYILLTIYKLVSILIHQSPFTAFWYANNTHENH